MSDIVEIHTGKPITDECGDLAEAIFEAVSHHEGMSLAAIIGAQV